VVDATGWADSECGVLIQQLLLISGVNRSVFALDCSSWRARLSISIERTRAAQWRKPADPSSVKCRDEQA